LPTDLDTFSQNYGLPLLNSGFFSQVAPHGLSQFDFGSEDEIGWAEEITLDVEWAHAIAPGAKIVLVLAKSDNDPDILSALRFAVDNDLGDVISMSFGENESCVDPVILSANHDIFAAATRKHITLFASSGDAGAAQPTCDGSSWVKAVSQPASDPLVAGVGGTELHAANYCLSDLGCDPTTSPTPGTYEREIVWNEPDFGATGGGFSVVFDQPEY
jgi:subtilase family serine protease